MEAKRYQDIQVLEKEKEKEVERKVKLKEFEKSLKDAELFKKQEADKKEEVKKKNLLNASQVYEQIGEEPRTFAKTGIAII